VLSPWRFDWQNEITGLKEPWRWERLCGPPKNFRHGRLKSLEIWALFCAIYAYTKSRRGGLIDHKAEVVADPQPQVRYAAGFYSGMGSQPSISTPTASWMWLRPAVAPRRA
jgi:hypothetical protein